LVADDKACLLKKVNSILMASKMTNVAPEPKDIRQLKKELRTVIKYSLGYKMKSFNQTSPVCGIP
jgi:hypothetical protein